MRKTLLTLVALMAAVSMSAQAEISYAWQKTLETVGSADNLGTICTTVAPDGSVYVSGTYDKDITFAGKTYANDGLASSYVAKYNKAGEEQWLATFFGACVITAMTTDDEGRLYVAGIAKDEFITITGTDGYANTDVKNPMVDSWGDMVIGSYSAFVTRFRPDGGLTTVRPITTATNAEVAASDFPFYLADEEPIAITPKQIKVVGDKVYVAVFYKGDIEELDWKGAYVCNFDFGMYMDNQSAGIFTLDKQFAYNLAPVANIQATGSISDAQHYPEAINFDVVDGKVYLGFFGFGNLTLSTPQKHIDFQFQASDDESGNMEHPFVLATIEADGGFNPLPFTYHSPMHSQIAAPYNIANMTADGDNILIGGTFSGQLPFDEAKQAPAGSSDVFLASTKKAEEGVNWAWTSGVESKAVFAAVDRGAYGLATGEKIYYVNKDDGKALSDGVVNYKMVAAAANGGFAAFIRTEGAKTIIEFGDNTETAVQSIKAADGGKKKVFNLQGQQLAAPQKGLNISDGKIFIGK